MACRNGRVNITATDERLLFAESGGYCARRGEYLFEDLGNRRVTVGQLAHIIAANAAGPRGESSLTDEERAKPDNIVLLCANCHLVVDQAPEEFPVELLRRWKRDRRMAQANVANVPRVQTRSEARLLLNRILSENRTIHALYGPESLGADDPDSERAQTWHRKVLETILPNSRRALAIADLNNSLLESGELPVVEEWRQHVDDLAARHVLGVVEVDALRFPPAVENLFDGDT